jgi:hypothetical protein
MAKLLVKDPKTGNIRPMTQKSFDLVGKKRGFTIVGKEAETGAKSEIQQHMDRLRAEKDAKNESGLVIDPVINNSDDAGQSDEPKERKKPGPKPKTATA